MVVILVMLTCLTCNVHGEPMAKNIGEHETLEQFFLLREVACHDQSEGTCTKAIGHHVENCPQRRSLV